MDTKSKVSVYSFGIKFLMTIIMAISVITMAISLSEVEYFYYLFAGGQTVDARLAPDNPTFLLDFPKAIEDDYMGVEPDENRVYRYYQYNDDGTFINTRENSDIYVTTKLYDGFVVDVYVSESRYYEELHVVEQLANIGLVRLIIAISAALLFLAASGVYAYSAGRKEKDGDVRIFFFNKIYNDVLLVIAGVLAFLLAILPVKFVFERAASILYYDGDVYSNSLLGSMSFIYLVVLVVALILLGLWLYVINCFSKRVKRREFFKYTLTFVIFKFAFKTIKTILKKLWSLLVEFVDFARTPLRNSGSKRLINYYIGIAVLSGVAFVIGMFILMALSALFTGYLGTFDVFVIALFVFLWVTLVSTTLYFYILYDVDNMKKAINEIRKGNVEYKIPIRSGSQLKDMMIDINNIGDGLAVATKKAVTSERMKSELITNVSHDLKTPLTAIISYVELLSKDEDLSAQSKDYVKILQKKSNSLSDIVSDVFDLAKSNSGTAEIEMERLNFGCLIEQTLADLGENIEKSGLVFVKNFPEKDIFVNADGKRLYRCFQNIIDNAVKYSMANTRVFVKLQEENGKAIASVMNVSSEPINFDKNEIKERFVRGDASRSTEGNGLGLAIAESFVLMCGGKFDIILDGDMFKTVIIFDVTE